MMSPVQSEGGSGPGISAEAKAICRYLLGVVPSVDLAERYVQAVSLLLPEAPAGAGGEVLKFGVRYRWSVGFLDAAAGLLDPQGPLRRRVIIMAAIVETEPRYASRFEAVDGIGRLVVRLAVGSVVVVGRVAIGLVLHGWVRWWARWTS